LARCLLATLRGGERKRRRGEGKKGGERGCTAKLKCSGMKQGEGKRKGRARGDIGIVPRLTGGKKS